MLHGDPTRPSLHWPSVVAKWYFYTPPRERIFGYGLAKSDTSAYAQRLRTGRAVSRKRHILVFLRRAPRKRDATKDPHVNIRLTAGAVCADVRSGLLCALKNQQRTQPICTTVTDPQTGVAQDSLVTRAAMCVRLVDVRITCGLHDDAQLAAVFIDPRAK